MKKENLCWCENCLDKDATICNPDEKYPMCYKPKDGVPASEYLGH